MPSVNVAMQRSLREGLVDLVAASLRPALQRRDGTLTNIGNGISDAKTAFSSWDNCMQASFCKWPVIALIIIGGLIIFSVVWCIIRCACCGLSCCCSCFQCLKCCGDCCGCCDPPKGRQPKYLDAPYIPPDHGYKSNAPMTTSAVPTVPSVAPAFSPAFSPAPAPVPGRSEPPQYAEFDMSKKGGHNEDSLPAMPSWEGSSSKKVALEEEAVEMNNLKKPDASGQNVPLMTGNATPGPASPGFIPPGFTPEGRSPPNRSPYGLNQDPYAQPGQGHGQNEHGYHQNGGYEGGYSQSQQSLGVDQGYMMAGGQMGPGRRSPRGYNDGGYGQQDRELGPPGRQGSFDQYGRPRQGSYDDYNQPRNGYGPNPGMGAGPGARRSPRPVQPNGFPQDPRARASPGPPQGDQGYNNARPYGPGRNYSSESTRPLVRPPPQRQYSRDVPPPGSPLQNTGGFDFNSGYSRPNTGHDNREPTLPQIDPSPASQQQPQQGYPGYKPYQPNNQQQGW
ncbi:hypothetical protein GQ53DRAFT_396153 [Thozetella sp. PMI_491]|nr:hypothetical protein GQ53DRAFT_396153 [Thozetella sp. PMI_491]